MRGVVSGNVGKINKAEYVGQYFLLSFSVAERVYQGSGKDALTCWHKCDYWGKGAEIAQYVAVGQHVDVFGQAYLHENESNGITYKNLVVKVQDLILGPKPNGASSGGPPAPQAQPQRQPAAAPVQPPAAPAQGNFDPPADIW